MRKHRNHAWIGENPTCLVDVIAIIITSTKTLFESPILATGNLIVHFWGLKTPSPTLDHQIRFHLLRGF